MQPFFIKSKRLLIYFKSQCKEYSCVLGYMDNEGPMSWQSWALNFISQTRISLLLHKRKKILQNEFANIWLLYPFVLQYTFQHRNCSLGQLSSFLRTLLLQLTTFSFSLHKFLSCLFRQTRIQNLTQLSIYRTNKDTYHPSIYWYKHFHRTMEKRRG